MPAQRNTRFIALAAVLLVFAACWLWLGRRPDSESRIRSAGQPPEPAREEPAAVKVPAGAAQSLAETTAYPTPVTGASVPVAAPAATVAEISLPVASASKSVPTVANPLDEAAKHPDEFAATARMYAAHAPLRTPGVADPDSRANKEILETMLRKALAASARPPADGN